MDWSFLTKLGTGAARAVSGFNWYKLAAEALVVIGVIAGTYGLAVHNCELKHEREQTAIAVNKTESVTREVAQRLPEVQRRDRVAGQQRAAIKDKGDKLNESLAKSGNAVGCNFTDDQLREFRELAEATR